MQTKILAILEVRRLTSNHSNRLAVRLPRSQSPPIPSPTLQSPGVLGPFGGCPVAPRAAPADGEPSTEVADAEQPERFLVRTAWIELSRRRWNTESGADTLAKSMADDRSFRSSGEPKISVSCFPRWQPPLQRTPAAWNQGWDERDTRCFVGAFDSVATRHGAKPQPIDCGKMYHIQCVRLRPFFTSARACS